MKEDQENLLPNDILFFRIAVSNSFKHIAECVSEDEFCDALTILKANPNVAKKLHDAMVKELNTSMNDDLVDILTEGSLQTGLAKVSKLSEDADIATSENAWRPPGDVNLHLRSLDAYKMKEESEKLEKYVTEIEEENAVLMKKIAESRSKMCATHDNVTRSLNKSPGVLERLGKTLMQLENCLKCVESE